MNKMTNGTEYRETPAGIVAVRGKRELYLSGTSVAQMERSREMLATISFNKLFSAGRKCPGMKNVASIKVAA